jgi:CRP-like cAMP-binding protein
MPAKERKLLLAACEPIELTLGAVVGEPTLELDYVYFPVDSFISLVALVEGSPGIEVGMVGSEGMFGVQLALGVTASPYHALVQGAGMAHRLAARNFLRQLDDSPRLREIINRYISALMAQNASSAACLRFHEVLPRLARWLLMTQDRAHSETFAVTQEFLGYMLGIRRVSVSQAAGDLQRAGLIKYARGQIEILDRGGLEGAACTCYATESQAYATALA